MSLIIPTLVANDSLINFVNSQNDLIENAVNDFDGSLIQWSTVANESLVKPKALFAVSIPVASLLAEVPAGGTVYSFKLPSVDGASNNSFRFTGVSAYVRTVTGSVAGNYLDVYKGASSVFGSPPVNLNTIVAGTPESSAPAAAVATATGDVWSVVFIKAGAPTAYDGVMIVLFFSLTHVGT